MKVENMLKIKEEFDYRSLCRRLEIQIDNLIAENKRQQKSFEDKVESTTIEAHNCISEAELNYADALEAEFNEDEEMLLMSYVELKKSKRESMWSLDLGCSSYTTGDKRWFVDIDYSFRVLDAVENICPQGIPDSFVDIRLQETVSRIFKLLPQLLAEAYHPRVGQALLQQLVRTDIGAEGTIKGRKQNRNKSKSWKIGEIKYKQNITCWNCNQKGHFHNQCLKFVSSGDKEVNIAVGDSDDALVCCVENTVEDRIMDFGASFHATYCKEELERFKLRSGKVRLADDKTLDIAGIGDVILKTSFGTSWTLKDVRYIPNLKRRLISVGQLDEEGYHVGFGDQQWKVTKGSLVGARGNKRGSLYMVEVHPKGIGAIIDGSGSATLWFGDNVSEDKETAETAARVAFGVAKRLSQTFRVESTRIRVEALKMLWADSVSTAYLIYRIPYVPIGLRIPEEEWRGKDTSLTYLKVFGCDSFVKSPGYPKQRYYSSSLTKPIQKSQVVLVDIPDNLAENDNIVAEHGLSLEITKSPGGSSDTSERSENSGSFEDSGRSDEEYSEDGASSKEGGSETPHVRRSTKESRALVRISAGKKASQRLWMFKVKEKQNGRKRYKARLVVKGFQQNREVDYNEIFSSLVKMTIIRLVLTQKRGFSASWAERKPRVQIEGNYVRTDSSTEAKVDDMLVAGSDMAEFNKPKWQLPLVFEMNDIYSEKQVLGYVLTVGVTTVEWESRLQKSIIINVHQVGDEREVEVLRSFNWPLSELITEDDVLPERGYSQFNYVSSGYLVSKVS
ncbi:retrovirus-related pol polyprotein from transposon TNT 1-94 [Tanacetum coccineum]|uniref:Retrovirus-related pol polyprotein from transposon TNT 1-94 n=1 Tax=Tanacetum coccineum TaxID=301880 RepID=A0ABQ5BPH0_9ASTR